MVTEPVTKKLAFGRMECPHCGEKRQGTEAMNEHIDSKHASVRRVADAVETIPGTDFAPEELVNHLEQFQETVQDAGWNPNDEDVSPESASHVKSFLANLPSLKTKSGQRLKLPEFIIMWTPDLVPRRVHSARMMSLIWDKGWTLRPPSEGEYKKVWFHWQCPIPTCKDHKADCEIHGEKGSDSNHPLKSPEFMMIQHLQSGGKLHRQYFEIHKDDLSDQYRAAFAAFELTMKEQADASERQRSDMERMQLDRSV